MRVYCVKEGHSKSRQYLLNILQKQKTKSSTLKTQRIMLKLLSMSVAFHQELFKKGIMMNFLAKLSRDSNVARQNTLVHSTPQACLGVTNRHDSMLPTSPKSLWVYWCDSDWFRLFSQKFLFGIQDATKHACSILHLHSPNVTMTCHVPCLQS